MECLGGASMAGMMSWMLIWALVGVAVLVAIVLGTVWLIRRGDGVRDRADSPGEILRRRFAAGEIDEAEYFRLRANLRE